MQKKDFNNLINPALQFMTEKEDAPGEETAGGGTASSNLEEMAAESKGLKRGRKPSTEETKTKRLNLLMLPSVCEDMGRLATMNRCSTNELINSILKDYIANNQDTLKKYNEVFESED